MGGATDLAGIFSACREATHELEHAVRAAVSHREKCAVVLGAALAVNIALAEADAVSPALDAFTQTQLKRLCSGILSTLGLAVRACRCTVNTAARRRSFASYGTAPRRVSSTSFVRTWRRSRRSCGISPAPSAGWARGHDGGGLRRVCVQA